MQTDKFTILLNVENTDLVFEITEHNNNNIVTYDVIIAEPKGYAKYHDLEQPLIMKYDPVNGHLVFKSDHDLSNFEDLEYSLSNEIMNRNN